MNIYRLGDMDDRREGSAGSSIRATPSHKPLKAGDAAAMGQQLMGNDNWVRIDDSGKALLVQVVKTKKADLFVCAHIILQYKFNKWKSQ